MAITKSVNFTYFGVTKTLSISDNFINTFGTTPHVYLFIGTSNNSISDWINLGDLSSSSNINRNGSYGFSYIAYGFFYNELSQAQKDFLIQTANIIYNPQTTYHFNVAGNYVVANMSNSSSPRLYDFTDYPSSITFDSVASVNKATFSNTLNNCSLSNPQVEYESETDYITNLVCNDKWHLDSSNLPYIQYTQGGIIKTQSFIRDDVFSCHLSFNQQVDNNSTISIIANLSMIKENIATVSITKSDDVTITNPPETINNTSLPKVLIFNKSHLKSYSETVLTYYNGSNVLQTVNGNITDDEVIFRIPDTVLYPDSVISVRVITQGQTIPINWHKSNCSVSSQPLTYELGTTLTLTFIPNENYFFNADVIAVYSKNNENLFINGVRFVENDTMELTIHITSFSSDTTELNIFAYANSSTDEITTTFGKGVTVYKLNDDNLNAIAHQRFQIIPENNKDIDLGLYIKSMRRFYIDIPDYYATLLKFGNFTLDSLAYTINNIFYEVSLGNTEIEKIFNTENDYKNIEIFALLPFVGRVELDTKLFIGKTINIKYRVDIINGNCKVFFTDVESGNLLHSVNANISVNIPYSTLVNSDIMQDINNTAIENNLYKDVEPKIILQYNDVLQDLYFDCDFVSSISDISNNDYFEVDEINYNSLFALKDEIELIENALRSGVIK